MSFADNKVIPTAGTYGAMLTDSEDLYNKLRALRKNGKPTRLEPYSTAGYSSQPEEEKAVQILASWQHLYKWQTRKQEISRYYFENFKNKITVRPRPAYSGWNAHKFAIMVDDKFSAYKKMLEAGVETEQHYADNFARLPWTPHTDSKFPMTDRFVKQSLTIPNNPFMTDAEVEIVTKKVIDILA
jgi:UDP-2-acetamido-2-deoxy-ribo-hexuluronate aminotransferase